MEQLIMEHQLMYSLLHFFLSQTFRKGETSSFNSVDEQYFELSAFLKI